jgi:hypothetical protein
MIACMEAPAIPGVDYNQALPPYNPNIEMSIHDKMIQDVLNLADKLAEQLQGYEGHIDGVKKHYQDCLEKELMRINEAGLRPEEREQARQG